MPVSAPNGKSRTCRPISLKYGSRTIPLSLPQGEFVGHLKAQTGPLRATPEELIAECLRQPIGSRPLRELAAGRNSAAILIPGRARLAGTGDYVPALVAELEAGGIAADRIEVFLADGTHEQHVAHDAAFLLGPQLASRVRCLGHDCRNVDGLIELGTTSYGTPVCLNRRVLEADLKILTGRIVPHYFAGFSGGRKALIPGVAGRGTILANHRLTLGPEKGIHPGARACVLDGNPIHEDMLEGARMARPDFCLNTLMDAEHRLVRAVAGDFEAAHRVGCRQAERWFRTTLDEPVDVLITSAGGNPYDCNFMQALKATFNVQDVVRPGGVILWVAECAGGMHNRFLEWAAIESDDEQEQAIRDRYDLAGHNSLMLRQLVRRNNVLLWSALPAGSISQLGLKPLNSLQAGLDWICRKFPHGFRYAVVPHANAICATLADRATTSRATTDRCLT
ncbi:MAG: nickel-dependent lactate racemase [Planctomycetaceae bacterium]